MCPRYVSHPSALFGTEALIVSTYKRDEVVHKNQDKADDRKVEKKSVVGERRIRQLVVQNHATGGNQIRENEAAEEDESVLRDAVPRRMAGTEKYRLHVFDRALLVFYSAMCY